LSDYSVYLPHIDVEEGKTRVMNNEKLYMTLLGKFKGRQMADDLISSMEANDHSKVVQYAHALRGTAGNLGFKVLFEITSEIEKLGKASERSSHLKNSLDDAVMNLEDAILKISN